jgi:hypothetical protein
MLSVSKENELILTKDELEFYVRYCPITGQFIWKQSPTNNTYAGEEAGTIINGYRYVIINKKRYAAHRLAWFYVYNVWPKNQIDHINRNKLDNRIENLRDVSRNVNNQNRITQSNNTTGYRGIRYKKKNLSWEAYIKVNKKQIYLGLFNNFEAALKARLDAEKHYGFIQVPV